jgi:hypothetical protein
VLLGAARDDRNDLAASQFGGFLDCPLESIELEDGEQENRSGDWASRIDHLPERKLDLVFSDANNGSEMNAASCADLILLSGSGTQYAGQVQSVLPYEVGAICIGTVG